MANVSRYRQGYEDVKREIAESDTSIASIPESFVKGIVGLPKEAIKEFFRDPDEDRGRLDALYGRSFDPFRHEREEKEREEAEREEKRAAEEDAKALERGRTKWSSSGPSVHVPGDSSDLTITFIKLGFAIAAFVIALMIVFASLPFWLGGMLVGWLAGFCMGVLRAHRLGVEGLREAPVHEGAKSGQYVVSEEFLNQNKKMPGNMVLPLLACTIWCVLLAWPVMQVMDELPWAGFASVGATIAGLVLGGIWAGKGFRRSLAWSARSAHGLPGGADAGWGGAGVGFGCILLVFLALIGKSLPDSLVRDFAKSRGNQPYQSTQRR
jgi:hypothetical protein